MSGETERPLAVTPAEAARLLSIGKSTVYALCAAGELECVRIGVGESGVRIPRDAVDAYFQRKREQSAARHAPSQITALKGRGRR